MRQMKKGNRAGGGAGGRCSSVPRSIMKLAVKCPRVHACVTGRRRRCRVEEEDGKDMLFLADRKPMDCPYRGTFSGLQVCRCPVRYEMFTFSGR